MPGSRKSYIHRKGKRGKPLTGQGKRSNRTKSTVWVRVEHVFGAQTSDMGGTLVRTIGLVRARAKIGMKNLAYNMRRLGQLRRVWRKIYIGIDEKTLEIRAAEFTTSDVGDAPMLLELLDQIPPDEEIASVTADGAFDTRKCHDAIAARGAHAVIPPRKTAKPWKTDTAGAMARNEALRAAKYLGRALRRQWSGYHRQSRVETKMYCVKLLG